MPYSTGLRLATRAQIVNTVYPANYTGAASTDLFISMKNASHVTFLVPTGAWAGGTAAVTVLQASAVAGTGSKAVAFDKMYTNATATTSATLVETTVSSNTFNLDTANALYVVEIDAAQLDTANGFDCVALHVATPGSNNDYYNVVAVLGAGVRYSGTTPPDAKLD